MGAITALEIRHKFKLHYDNVLSGAAPGLNDYEISLYLTQAFKEIIYNAYNGNSKGEAVDDTERMKSLLSLLTNRLTLTKTGEVNSPIKTDTVQYPGFTFNKVVLPEKVWFLLRENIVQNSTPVLVKPIAQDEFWVILGNPHRQPNKYRALRLDETSDSATTRELIIVSYGEIQSYSATYIIKQPPIILSTLTDILAGLTIEGTSAASIPTVVANTPWLADMIINRAVELATRDYKTNTLETQLALNSRVE